jgi:hypothetical protein
MLLAVWCAWSVILWHLCAAVDSVPCRTSFSGILCAYVIRCVQQTLCVLFVYCCVQLCVLVKLDRCLLLCYGGTAHSCTGVLLGGVGGWLGRHRAAAVCSMIGHMCHMLRAACCTAADAW